MYIQGRQNTGKIVGREIKITQKLEKDLEQMLVLQGRCPLPLRLQRKSRKQVQKPSTIYLLRAMQMEGELGVQRE